MRLALVKTGGAMLALALMVNPVWAQFVDEEPVGRLTIGPQVGVLVPNMGDINDNIEVVNRFLNRDEIRSMDSVDGALVTGLDVRYKLSDKLSLAANWGALAARSEFDVTRVTTRFFSRATTYQFSGYYHFPFATNLNERLQFFAGGGLVLLRSGRVEWGFDDNTVNFFIEEGDVAELSGRGKATGEGTGFTLSGGGSYQLSGRFSVALDIGYRIAKLTDLEIDPNDVEGDFERFGFDEEEEEDPIVREPGDWAIWDFFLRDPDARLPDGRHRDDAIVPGDEHTGCAGCPMYFDGGPIEVDFSGFFSTLYLRVHF